MGVLFLARIYKRRIILLLNWQPCFGQGCFFAAEKSEKEKVCKKSENEYSKKILKKNKKKKKKNQLPPRQLVQC